MEEVEGQVAVRMALSRRLTEDTPSMRQIAIFRQLTIFSRNHWSPKPIGRSRRSISRRIGQASSGSHWNAERNRARRAVCRQGCSVLSITGAALVVDGGGLAGSG